MKRLGHQVEDLGTYDRQPVDYPDLARLVASKVSGGQVDRGVLLSGTGLGMSVAANKFPGVRAAACHDDFTVAWGRRHLDLNVLCLPADLLSQQLAVHLVETWLETPFEGGRHARRVAKIKAVERQLGLRPRSSPSRTARP